MTKATDIRLPYVPRAAFVPFHKRTKRYTVIVAHRRAGKTYSVLQDLVARALYYQKRDPQGSYYTHARFGYLCPYKGQAKTVAWQYLTDFTKDIPGVKKNESELWVEIPTVSGGVARIILGGADNPDNMRGGYWDGIVLDEYGDMKPEVYSTVIRPSLADRNGWVVFMGTPKGKNDFHARVQKALENPDRYFYLCLKASTSGILSDKEIAEMRDEMEPEILEQELECSFDAAFQGSFYGKYMTIANDRFCFRPVEWIPGEPVSLAMDIGRRDATAIWFWQIIDGEVRFIEYYEQTGEDAVSVCEMLMMKPYEYETVWLPHDALHETFASAKSVIDTFISYDLPARKVPNPDAGNRIFHGIDSVRKFLRLWTFAIDTVRCKQGIEALKNYSRRLIRSTGLFSNEAKHDEWSHGADAFRYAVLAISPEAVQRSKAKAHKARMEQQYGGPINTSAQTLNDMFAERERKLRIQRQDSGRAYR
jgi:phage terminase large subunit